MSIILRIVALVNLAIVVYGNPMLDYVGKTCGHFVETVDPNWRIINGKDAKVGEFPWHSLIDLIVEDKQRDSNNFCGGSIINERWVLTAGHCLMFSKASLLKVRFGVHSFTNEPDKNEVDIDIEKFIIHDHFIFSNNVSNDIALIKLKNNLDFNGAHKHLTPVCLAKKDTKLTKRCVVTGFGLVNETGSLRPKNGILQKLDDTLADPSYCEKQFPGIFNNKEHICVGDTVRGRKGVCYLDSGGPLQCKGDDGRWYQVGTVSYGTVPCDAHNKIDAFMRVSYYRDWIEETIKNN